MVLHKAQPRDRGVEFPGIHENDQRVVARARRERFRRERPQQRVIDTARRDAAERQIVVFGDRGDDVAAART